MRENEENQQTVTNQKGSISWMWSGYISIMNIRPFRAFSIKSPETTNVTHFDESKLRPKYENRQIHDQNLIISGGGQDTAV